MHVYCVYVALISVMKQKRHELLLQIRRILCFLSAMMMLRFFVSALLARLLLTHTHLAVTKRRSE